MAKGISAIKSIEQLYEYFKTNQHLINKKDATFMDRLLNDWDEGHMSRKLRELNLDQYAQKIDKINPYQSNYDICKEIYKIILGEEEKIKPEDSPTNDNFDMDRFLMNLMLPYDLS